MKKSVRQEFSTGEGPTDLGASYSVGGSPVSLLGKYGAVVSGRAVAAADFEREFEGRGLVNVFVVFIGGTPGAEKRLREVVTRLDWNGGGQAEIEPGSAMDAGGGELGEHSWIEGIGARPYSWLNIDEGRKSVSVNGGSVDLSRKEYDALLCLYRKNGAVCSRDELIDSVWPEASNGEGVSDAAIDQLIRRLRLKVEAGTGRPEHLLSKKGFGFLLV